MKLEVPHRKCQFWAAMSLKSFTVFDVKGAILSLRRSLFRSSRWWAHARPQPPLPPRAVRWQEAGRRSSLPLPPPPPLLLLLPLPSPPASTPRCELLSGYKLTPELDLISVTGTTDNTNKVFSGALATLTADLSPLPSSSRCWADRRWR